MGKDNTPIQLPPGKLAFHHMDTPKAWNQGDEPKYDLTLAWPVKEYEGNDEWKAIKRAIHNVAVAEWGDRASVKRDGAAPYKVPFRYGADREANPEQFEGYVLATFRSKYPVSVVELMPDAEPAKVKADILAKGMSVIVAVKPKAWVGNGRGITLYPHAIAIEDRQPDLNFNEATEGGGEGGSGFFNAQRAAPRRAETDDTSSVAAGVAVGAAVASSSGEEVSEVVSDDDIPF